MYLPSYAGVWANRYPTQLILAAFDLALFALLWSRRENVRVDGNLAFLYLFCFTLGRILIDSLRELPHVLGTFSPHQLASIVILLVTAYIFFELRFLGRTQKNMAG
jgi:phosphatidylglycerol:prolipoprotein diacylglycerol transferase